MHIHTTIHTHTHKQMAYVVWIHTTQQFICKAVERTTAGPQLQMSFHTLADLFMSFGSRSACESFSPIVPSLHSFTLLTIKNGSGSAYLILTNVYGDLQAACESQRSNVCNGNYHKAQKFTTGAIRRNTVCSESTARE